MSPSLRAITRLIFCVLFAISILACQTTRPVVKPPEMVYPLALLNKDPDMLDTMFQNISNGQAATVKIEKDYIFPLVFDLQNNAADVDLNNNTIELSFKQDMYLSISKETTKLSRDGRNWSDIKDLAALKKLLAYKKGALTFSMAANSGDSVAIVMTIATDAK